MSVPRISKTVAASAIWACALVVCTIDLKLLHATWWLGSDFEPTRASIIDMVHGRALDAGFVYPPSVLVLGLPFALFQHHGLTANYLLLIIELAAVVAGFWAMLKETGGTVRDPRIAMIGLILALSGQVIFMLQLENLSALLICCACLFYVLASRGRWDKAAATLGMSLAIKPMLFPLYALLLLRHKWRASAVCVVIPVALNLVALPFVPDTGAFLRRAISLTLGSQATHEAINANLLYIARLLHLGHTLSVAVRVLVAVAALLTAARVRNHSRAGLRCYVWVGSILLAGLLCCTSETHTYYPLMLLPLAFVALDEPSRIARYAALAGLVLTGWAPTIAGTNANLQFSSASTQTLICIGMLLVILAGSAVRYWDTELVASPIQAPSSPIPAQG